MIKNGFLLFLSLILTSVSLVFSQEKGLQDTEALYQELKELIEDLEQTSINNKRYTSKLQWFLNCGGYLEYTPLYLANAGSYKLYPSRRAFLEGRQKNYDLFLRQYLWSYDEAKNPKDELDISDFKKLAWIIKINKESYCPNEPIEFSVFLRNISAEEVKILNVPSMPAFFLCSMKIKRDWEPEYGILEIYAIRGSWREREKQEVPLTKEGIRIHDTHPFYNEMLKLIPILRPLFPEQLSSLPENISESITLKPGDTVEIYNPIKTLNRYYDLSRTGEYELTFFTRNFLGSDEEQVGECPKPCTVRFKIEGTENWLDDYVRWETPE